MKLSDHFNVPADSTKWNGEYTIVAKHGRTPARQRADFQTPRYALEPITAIAKELDSVYGIYAIGVEYPSPAIYIGIAAGGSKSPEGILSRIRKHRVKITGSHVGKSRDTVGGVNHTAGWRYIAKQRSRLFQASRLLDTCQDVWLRIGAAHDTAGAPLSDKATLEIFESMLASNHQGLYRELAQSFWPKCETIPECLTVRFRKLEQSSALAKHRIQF